MPNVTEDAAQVGQMLINALQNTLGMGPEAAVAQAQAETGVSDDTVQHADMGQVFDYMCNQPGLSPEVQSYLSQAQSNYTNNYGNVNQSGSSYSGGSSSSGSSGYGGGSGASSNAQIVQQVTQNYNYQEINDNHIDVLGQVDGDITIDQNNNDIHDLGDGNAVNTGDGNQNAATGDHSSASQSQEGNAVSNTGDGAVTSGDDTNLNHSAVGDGNTILDNTDGSYLNNEGGSYVDNQGGTYDNHSVTGDGTAVDNRDATIDNHSASNGSTVLDNHDGGTVSDSSLGFGAGDVQGDVYNEQGAANSQGGDAHGHNTTLNLGSEVTDEHGPGDQNVGQPSDGGELVHETVIPTQEHVESHVADQADQHEPSHESDALSDHLAPQVDTPDTGADHALGGEHDVMHH